MTRTKSVKLPGITICLKSAKNIKKFSFHNIEMQNHQQKSSKQLQKLSSKQLQKLEVLKAIKACLKMSY